MAESRQWLASKLRWRLRKLPVMSFTWSVLRATSYATAAACAESNLQGVCIWRKYSGLSNVLVMQVDGECINGGQPLEGGSNAEELHNSSSKRTSWS
jgi:hypothetical protein